MGPGPNRGPPDSGPRPMRGPPDSGPRPMRGPPDSGPRTMRGHPDSGPHPMRGHPDSGPRTMRGPPDSGPRSMRGPPDSGPPRGGPRSPPRSDRPGPSAPGNMGGLTPQDQEKVNLFHSTKIFTLRCSRWPRCFVSTKVCKSCAVVIITFAPPTISSACTKNATHGISSCFEREGLDFSFFFPLTWLFSEPPHLQKITQKVYLAVSIAVIILSSFCFISFPLSSFPPLVPACLSFSTASLPLSPLDQRLLS